MSKKRLALLGCGYLNNIVADAYLNGMLEDYEIVGVMGKSEENIKALSEKLGCAGCSSMEDLLALKPDYVAEAASGQAVRTYAEQILGSGANLVVISIGAFADKELYQRVQKVARANGTKVYIASGAVGGFDVLRTISLMGEAKTKMTSRKSPRSIRYTPLYKEGLLEIDQPTEVFSGTSKQAIEILPTMVNVSVATALASVGPENLGYRINCEPDMVGDDYVIETEVEELGMKAVLNIYSRTSEIAGWSIVEVLQNAESPIVF